MVTLEVFSEAGRTAELDSVLSVLVSASRTSAAIESMLRTCINASSRFATTKCTIFSRVMAINVKQLEDLKRTPAIEEEIPDTILTSAHIPFSS
ncbi:Hypothetical protein GL50581_3093 [Giardia duodenalis ATCC 50581]|nr:Hypothetical protein GL50581_3093 [Giardia intestinalis ATCC 50581]